MFGSWLWQIDTGHEPRWGHKEISFENEICDYLAAHGWLYAEGDAAKYDRARALFPADVLAWVQATQPPRRGRCS
jgi:hypothetical protein